VGRGVYGHSHTYARYNGAVNIGTSTFLRANYNAEGFSNWSQSLALVGENGEIQVLEFRNNEWYRPLNDQQKIQPEEFLITTTLSWCRTIPQWTKSCIN
jgi:hypothetical protein